MSETMTEPNLTEAWADLLRRRPVFRDTLGVYGEIVEAWARWSPPRPLAATWDERACRARWDGGTPLIAAAETLRSTDVEDLVGSVMETLARAVPDLARGFQRFAEAWDAGRLDPRTLLPAPGRVGSGVVEEATGLGADVVALLATLGLRPALEAVFAQVREHLPDGVWALGICPFCGGPPGFIDVVEDGRRRLACHLCGGAWIFAKLRCPFCGVDGAEHLVRLTPEEAREEGYVISACRECHAYTKELDRRVRWNGGPPLVEDWGSPHFDLIARRQQYWRPDASIVLLAGAR
jgi:Protein involved in formate dehydrogenase formation